jgi:hypothetical protein
MLAHVLVGEPDSTSPEHALVPSGFPMSDMEDFIDVKVTRRGREVAEGCYKLPVTIGRGEHNSVRIGHSPQDMTISRTHDI